ncbi:MAG TPA: sulfite exporter TauE/SafE family protein [Candidatus Nanoarchaeia archaeon]|nr:sulfite exporter TauE/SafE family protein [Candidatus Nanoarchaeia archaeon]
MLEHILLFAIALFAAVISSTVGIGAALILVPLASLVIPIKQAVAVTNIYFITLAVSKVITFREHIDWPTSRDILYGAVPFAVLGSYAFVFADSDMIKRILGAVIILTMLMSELPAIKNRVVTRPMCIAAGGAYGFFFRNDW